MTDFLNLILEPLQEVFLKFKTFVPNLLAMLVILITGILLARVLRAILIRFLKAINFDSWSDRMRVTTLLRKGDLCAKHSLWSSVIVKQFLAEIQFGSAAVRVEYAPDRSSTVHRSRRYPHDRAPRKPVRLRYKVQRANRSHR